MFTYHEKSQCITISPELTVRYLANRLRLLGHTLGYCPLEGDTLPIETCLRQRLPNRYFLKYGDIAELCLGWKATLSNGSCWEMTPYPRAAMGPDLRQFLVGSGSALPMDLEACTLKLFPVLPEEQILVYQFDDKPDVTAFIYWMRDHFIRPLAVWMGPTAALSLTSKFAATDGYTVVLCLSERSDLFAAKVTALDHYLELRKGHKLSAVAATDQLLLHKILHGHHALNRGLIVTVMPSLPNGGDKSNRSRQTSLAWLTNEWHGMAESLKGKVVC